ncbi:hypothetical protein ZTR_10586 [Talaromyces verruculosus]|nr:hypothetical protein ZTR_10586 [Talaromyces verruculosus]
MPFTGLAIKQNPYLTDLTPREACADLPIHTRPYINQTHSPLLMPIHNSLMQSNPQILESSITQRPPNTNLINISPILQQKLQNMPMSLFCSNNNRTAPVNDCTIIE